jgi:hypothetical protein
MAENPENVAAMPVVLPAAPAAWEDGTILDSEEFIPDNDLVRFASTFGRPKYHYLFNLDKLSNGQAPYIFNQANTDPRQLPGLLFPKDDNGVAILEGGIVADDIDAPSVSPKKGRKPKGVTAQTVDGKIKEVFKQIGNRLIDQVKADFDLELCWIGTQPPKKPKTFVTQQKFEIGNRMILYCKRCKNPATGHYTKVVETKMHAVQGEEGAPYNCYMHVTEFWFHDRNCCKSPSTNILPIPGQGGPLRNAPGYELIPATAHGRIEQVRIQAYQRWIDNTHLYQQPDGNSANSTPSKKLGMPPGRAIRFEYHRPPHPDDEDHAEDARTKKAEDAKDAMITRDGNRDNRMQLALNALASFSGGLIDKEAHTQFVAWHLYRIISRYNLTREFTNYRPHPNPAEENLPQSTGNFVTCLAPDPNHPVHLFLDGIHILFGGMQLQQQKDKLLGKGEEPYLHQMAHSDFASPDFNWPAKKDYDVEDFPLAANSPLLRDLSHPATINVALETERTMWINNNKHVVTFKKNEAVANSADTTHGGMSWNAHNHKDAQARFLYKPSLHMVLGSVRFPQIPNAVKINVQEDTYCPPEHTPWMSSDEIEEELMATKDRYFKLLLKLPLKHLEMKNSRRHFTKRAINDSKGLEDYRTRNLR